MQIEILTPEKKLFEGEAESITLPGTNGLFQILNNHAPIVSSLEEGTIKVKGKGVDENIDINSGFVECLKNKVIVLVES
jgi:F-type H+-transporting ATPase subunit epsilon